MLSRAVMKAWVMFSDAFNTYRELIKEKQSYSVAEESLGRLKLLVRRHKSLKLRPTDRLNCGMVFLANKQVEVCCKRIGTDTQNRRFGDARASTVSDGTEQSGTEVAEYVY